MFGGQHALLLDQCFAGELCTSAVAAAHALVLPIGQMPEVLIIPSIMLRRGQNGMNVYEFIVRLDAAAKEEEAA